MVVPTSVDAQFRRLEKQLRELKHLETNALGEDQAILVAEICNSCLLTLDKAMNAVWAGVGTPREGKCKPNIYFPVTTGSREKLIDKFRQYQMPEAENTAPEIFEIIESVQVYNGARWLEAIYRLAEIRHEEYPKIKDVPNRALGVGKRQGLYIESLTIDAAGNVNFKGHGINRESGESEAVRFEIKDEVRRELESVGQEPFPFCRSSVTRVKQLVSDLYRHLPDS